MGDIFSDASLWLLNEIVVNCSSDIVYVRTDGSTTTVPAALGRTEFTVSDTNGMVTDVVSHDFIVPANRLDFTPERGDVIRSNGSIYEVLAPSGEPHWRWCDRYHRMKRIHTKETGQYEEERNMI